MKYQGTIKGERLGVGEVNVYIDDKEQGIKPITPERSQKLYNHSPDGFEYGYGGSGPSQLALAILLELTDDEAVALRFYHDFKRDCIAILGGYKFEIPIKDIQTWLAPRIKAMQQEQESMIDT